MKCPKCGGKVWVKSTVSSFENEIYRQRQCIMCGYWFYTCEFEVENTNSLDKEFHRLRNLGGSGER